MSKVPTLVRDYMSSKVATLREDQNVREAVEVFTQYNVFSAVVLNNIGNLVGIVSVSDCIHVAMNSGYNSGWRGTVGELMSRDVRVVETTDNIINVAKMFMSDNYRRYPVIDDNRVVGVITRLDVLKGLNKIVNSSQIPV
ncbi:CBS domain-containing protein [Thiofilum flexile]|uniref:CBS domain-containing protein n=1 Tax=Thiofilum flexile TaxID=125627 RepID=UPI000378075F|nr:CBS domain-containing protein [Thiofilum flexile]